MSASAAAAAATTAPATTTTTPCNNQQGTPNSNRKAFALDLKRSTKMDFARERSFIQYSRRNNNNNNNNSNSNNPPKNGVAVQHQQHHAAIAAAAGRATGKPSIEIYRPPSLRLGPATDGSEQVLTSPSGVVFAGDLNGPRLNVHAKEFTMTHAAAAAAATASSHNGASSAIPHHLAVQTSHHHASAPATGLQHQSHHQPLPRVHNRPLPLQQSYSIGNMLSNTTRVHFQDDLVSTGSSATLMSPTHANSSRPKTMYGNNSASVTNAAIGASTVAAQIGAQGGVGGLQRSKSLGAADVASREPGIAREAPELGIFPGEVLTSIRRAVTDPNQMSARSLMALVRQILQRVAESARYAAPAAKLCITIIEKEHQETFLESLLNTCTQWYQERDRLLRNNAAIAVLLPGAPAPSCPRWVAFMTFLNEMYCQLKRRQLQLRTKPQGISPEMLLLGLLYDSCHVCLRPPAVNSLGETECLFFVLTSIGRDLDAEMSMRMPALMAALRDAFLTASLPGVRKTLLQLIEMRAARWQLPAPAVMYYYPGSGAIK